MSASFFHEHAPAFAESWARHLRLTGVSSSGLLADILNTPSLSQLNTFHLALAEQDERAPGDPIGNDGAAMIAGCPHFARLRHLKLLKCNINNHGFKALAESPHLTDLRELDLSENHIGHPSDVVIPVEASAVLQSVERLNLHNGWVGDDLVSQIAASPYSGRVTHLVISSGELTDAGGVRLIESPT